MYRTAFLLLTSILTIVTTVLALLIFIEDYNKSSLSVERPVLEGGPGAGWAVLVAGSRGWDNYRHQADVCHAYQLLRKHGVSEDRIIVMMYDDIAESPDNPNKGEIYNQPGGENVYANVKKDYTGEDVTAENFLAVLQGDEAAVAGVGSGKVLHSGPHDDIFIYFADHGAYGIVSFPHDFLTSQTLIATLKLMQQKERYRQVLFYLEACESGSMFEDLGHIGVLAVTASNSTSPSFACYYDHHLKTFLADVFSISWLDDSDGSDHQRETIFRQIEIVSNKTQSLSQTSVYGDTSIQEELVGIFQGAQGIGAEETLETGLFSNPVESYDVPLARLLMDREQNKRKIQALLQRRNEIDETFNKIKTTLREYLNYDDDGGNEIEKDCYFEMVHAVHHHCYNLGENSFALRKLRSLGMFCDRSEFSNFTSKETRKEIVSEKIKEVCKDTLS